MKREMVPEVDMMDVGARQENLAVKGEPIMLQLCVVPAYALTVASESYVMGGDWRDEGGVAKACYLAGAAQDASLVDQAHSAGLSAPLPCQIPNTEHRECTMSRKLLGQI